MVIDITVDNSTIKKLSGQNLSELKRKTKCNTYYKFANWSSEHLKDISLPATVQSSNGPLIKKDSSQGKKAHKIVKFNMACVRQNFLLFKG